MLPSAIANGSVACGQCRRVTSDFSEWTECPASCGLRFCSIKCLLRHSEHSQAPSPRNSCCLPHLNLPAFGEIFSGAEARLTWAVSNLGVHCVAPYDISFHEADSFFTSIGRRRLERFDSEQVVFEWCFPYSRVLDHWHLVEQAPLRTKDRLRRALSKVEYAALRLRWRLANAGVCCIALPSHCPCWHDDCFASLWSLTGIYFDELCLQCFGANSYTVLGLLHNSKVFSDILRSRPRCNHSAPLHTTPLVGELPWELCCLVARGVHAVMRDWEQSQLPIESSLRPAWISTALSRSTTRLAQDRIQELLMPQLMQILSSVKVGGEMDHLKDLLRSCDHRGSDVRLASQVLLDGCRQEVPYPAFIWKWKATQSYPWRQTQHINALEFAAFLLYCRSQSETLSHHHTRFFHVFDSRVVSCIVAKGRSSSKLLNRLCRRYAAQALGTDSYVLTLWTISDWNFSDAASRRLTDQRDDA